MRRKVAAWAALDPLHRSTVSLPYSIEYHHVGHPPHLTTAHGQSTMLQAKFNSSTLGSSSANSSQRRVSILSSCVCLSLHISSNYLVETNDNLCQRLNGAFAVNLKLHLIVTVDRSDAAFVRTDLPTLVTGHRTKIR